MKTTSVLIAVVATAAGTVGAAWAYDTAAPPVETPRSASTETTITKPVAQRPRLVWAPCRPPAVLRKGACVTDEVRTVVLPAPAAPVTRYDDDPDQAFDDHADDDHADDDHADDEHADDEHADDEQGDGAGEDESGEDHDGDDGDDGGEDHAEHEDD